MEKQEKRIEVIELEVQQLNHGFPNPRKKPTPKKKAALQDSLEKLGDFGVIVIDENNDVISGNQRCKVLMELDPATKVLCKRLIGYSESEKKAVNIKANTHAGEFDMKMLADWTADLRIDLSSDLKSPEVRDPKIKGMDLMRFEKYDYVMIVCRSEPDYLNLIRSLGLEGKTVTVGEDKTKGRKLKCRAIWYDDIKAQIISKDEIDENA
ncbi:hypothetical protein [Bacteroides acidifaciens]|uniref:hypothetical protein n=1 Tax=Bacteroides acidifaciens TaxID=85831 RepID=UPI0025950D02|nr:hypothetical protein [Bacteroides acidifaciens]